MYEWIAKYCRDDNPYEDELRICIDGTEEGFIIENEDGEDLDLGLFFTEDDAIEALRDFADRLDTFEWL